MNAALFLWHLDRRIPLLLAVLLSALIAPYLAVVLTAAVIATATGAALLLAALIIRCAGLTRQGVLLWS